MSELNEKLIDYGGLEHFRDLLLNDSGTTSTSTWSSSKINEEIQAVGGTADSEFDGKTTEDFRFVTELPQEATEGEQVVIKGENVDTLYKYVSGAWAEQTPDATVLYFDTENEALYSYVSAEQQFATISSVNTIIVGKNLNTSEALKAIKTPGTYSVLQRTSSTTKGEYTKKWTLTVEGIDYDEYELTDSVYQRIQSNYTIQKRTWSSTRTTNDGWSNFSVYYAGEIKDSTTSKYYTWSSNKISGELDAKQNILPENVTELPCLVYEFENTTKGLTEIPADKIDADGNLIINNTIVQQQGFGAYGLHKSDVLENPNTIYDGSRWYYNAMDVELLNYSKIVYRVQSSSANNVYGLVRGLADEITMTPPVSLQKPLSDETKAALVAYMEGLEGKVVCWNGIEGYIVGFNDVSHTPKIYSYTESDAPYTTTGNGIFAGHTLLKKGHYYKIHCVRFNHYFEKVSSTSAQYISGWVLTFDEIGDLIKTVEYTAEKVDAKQDTLTAGENIEIAANTISAKGYVFDESVGGFATKYVNSDDENNVYVATNTASKSGAFAEGWNTTASGEYGTHAEGYETTASGEISHAEGYSTTASGNYGSHAEGYQSVASGEVSHAEGSSTASSYYSHAEGQRTTASGNSSHSEGAYTTAQNITEHAEGYFNVSHKATSTSQYDGNAGNTQHSVGIGSSESARKNAFEIMQNGDIYVKGIGGYQGTNTKVQDNTIKTLQEYIATLEARIAALENPNA
jgi:hypothetical protein